MFLASLEVRDPMVSYMERQMAMGTFRRMDPALASRAFLGMFVSHIQMQEIFGHKKRAEFSREEVVKTRLHRARGMLPEELFDRVGASNSAAFTFHASRCDRIVRRVFEAIGRGF